MMVSVMKQLIFNSCLLACCAGSMAYGEVTVKPSGIQMVWDDGAKLFDGFKTFNQDPGAKLAFIFKSDGDAFVGLDEDASSVKVGGVDASFWFFASQAMSEDRKAMKMSLIAKGAEVKDGRLPVKGEIVVMTASGKEELKTDLQLWEKGGKVAFPEAAGLPVFTIDKIAKSKWDDKTWDVTLKCKKEFDSFVSVKFVDEEGKEHEAERGSWSSMGVLGMRTVTVSYRSKYKPTKARMVVEVWKGVEKVKLPIDYAMSLVGPEQ